MAGFARFVMSTLNAGFSVLTTGSMQPSQFETPTVEDVLEVKDILGDAAKLPIEIIDNIIDFAEYWPRTSVVTRGLSTAIATIRTHQPSTSENLFLLRSFPVGYMPSENNDNEFLIPTEQYQDAAVQAAERDSNADGEEGKEPWNATSEILKEWSKRSLPRGEHPVRKVVFTIVSHDQGWGGSAAHRNTYEGSYSWFDVGKERVEAIDTNKRPALSHHTTIIRQSTPQETESGSSLPICGVLRSVDPPVIKDYTDPSKVNMRHDLLPSDSKLQSNITANHTSKEHIITWSWNDCVEPESTEADELENIGRGRKSGNGEYVRGLTLGDIVTVWAKARFQGWSNHVEKVKVDVYYAI